MSCLCGGHNLCLKFAKNTLCKISALFSPTLEIIICITTLKKTPRLIRITLLFSYKGGIMERLKLATWYFKGPLMSSKHFYFVTSPQTLLGPPAFKVLVFW